MERLSNDVYDNWQAYARQVAASGNLDNFRWHPHLQYMLEHRAMGLQSRAWFEQIEPLRIKLGITRRCVAQAIAANEQFGKSLKNSAAVPELPACNAVSLRYAYLALRVIEHWAILNVTVFDHVVEIGGGYGGFAVVLLTLLQVTGRPLPQTYTLIDLPGVSDLQQAYVTRALPAVPVTLVFAKFDADNMPAVSPDHYLFSSYSFSEIPKAAQQVYAHTVLQSTRAGLLVWNSTSEVSEDIQCGPTTRFTVSRAHETVYKMPTHYRAYILCSSSDRM